MQPLWGIDLGGTKIEGVVIESKDNLKVLHRHRIPTEKDQGYEHVQHQILKLIREISTETGLKPERIGMGTPGTMDPITQKMKNCNITAINGRLLKQDLEIKSGLQFNLANDANCFAVAEANFGAVKEHLPNAEVVFGVIMGTGVGGGVVVNHKVINGRQGIGGEWGHNFLDASGGKCYCGKIGCVETVISGPALERFYTSLTGNTIKLPDIYQNHLLGQDPAATATMERLIHYFGKSIAYIINILDPDAIVLGGGVGNIDLLYTEGVKEAAKHVFNYQLDTLFFKPALGDSAGVFGAALL